MPEQANIVTLRAHAGKIDALGQALEKMIALTRQEPGSAYCELHQSADDARNWMVYERWSGADAFASHMQQPYVAEFLSRLEELVCQAPLVQAFHHRAF
jgi:quinol monooxygenase YgiN